MVSKDQTEILSMNEVSRLKKAYCIVLHPMAWFFLMVAFSSGCSLIKETIEAPSGNCGIGKEIYPGSEVIVIEYANSKSGDIPLYSVLLSAPPQYNGSDIGSFRIISSVYPALIIPLPTSEGYKPGYKSAYFFAEKEWLDGNFCVEVSYYKRDQNTGNLIGHFQYFFMKIEYPNQNGNPP